MTTQAESIHSVTTDDINTTDDIDTVEIAAHPAGAEPLLAVRNLDVVYDSSRGRHHAVRDVSFALYPGESVGLVGESGSGKSTLLRALARLLGREAQLTGTMDFEGADLAAMSERQLRSVRGGRIGKIFQDPVNTLNPSIRVGTQLARILRLHRPELSRADRENEVGRLLSRVGVDPKKRRNYPFEFSQGQLQRIAIAAGCLAGRPALVLADEPTTSLDVTVEAQVLELLREVREDYDLTLVLVTHDLALIAEMCERTLVMYAGTIVEELPATALATGAQHPYTELLVGAIPPFPSTGGRLSTVPPALREDTGSGCVFASRCPKHVGPVCDTVAPRLRSVPGAAGRVACHVYDTEETA